MKTELTYLEQCRILCGGYRRWVACWLNEESELFEGGVVEVLEVLMYNTMEEDPSRATNS